MEILFVDFLNSEWRDWRGSGAATERLSDPQWVARFLDRWELTAPTPDGQTLQMLRRFRSLLQRMVNRLDAGEHPAPEDLEQCNDLLRQAPFTRQVIREGDQYHLILRAESTGWDRVVAHVAASFADVLAVGDLRRIKVCQNPNCLWVFYDQSKNRARRWCNDSACGNLDKVRRFRARQKENHS
jgi:predicted RNA-binding Zn ribbon-like protein